MGAETAGDSILRNTTLHQITDPVTGGSIVNATGGDPQKMAMVILSVESIAQADGLERLSDRFLAAAEKTTGSDLAKERSRIKDVMALRTAAADSRSPAFMIETVRAEIDKTQPRLSDVAKNLLGASIVCRKRAEHYRVGEQKMTTAAERRRSASPSV